MIVFDLDGTLADCEHRRHFVEKGHPKNLQDVKLEYGDTIEIKKDGSFEITNRMDRLNWKPDYQAFYEGCDKDTLIKPAFIVYTSIRYEQGAYIEIWSGRCESVREKTEKWLDDHDIAFETLKMRPIGDNTPNHELKEKWLHEYINSNEWTKQVLKTRKSPIDFVFDSDPESIRMWRRRGVFVFNCCQHEDEF